ncbi:hypothetical protein HYH03_001787 [Edaphochlamys debaryana]|uniref:Uncharacterized protein n=1 Tax=Edaphochlamys debaryana TaxID=47281 RepID=A0A835YM48_9CHLO|nr:hypothetical protein HYH03_001787 [Edaphochlamys debaryana]|eukprot:KAG2500209.1 hypothetical protein HYH03_001787 [Edaphochlamys debaryana]
MRPAEAMGLRYQPPPRGFAATAATAAAPDPKPRAPPPPAWPGLPPPRAPSDSPPPPPPLQLARSLLDQIDSGELLAPFAAASDPLRAATATGTHAAARDGSRFLQQEQQQQVQQLGLAPPAGERQRTLATAAASTLGGAPPPPPRALHPDLPPPPPHMQYRPPPAAAAPAGPIAAVAPAVAAVGGSVGGGAVVRRTTGSIHVPPLLQVPIPNPGHQTRAAAAAAPPPPVMHPAQLPLPPAAAAPPALAFQPRDPAAAEPAPPPPPPAAAAARPPVVTSSRIPASPAAAARSAAAPRSPAAAPPAPLQLPPPLPVPSEPPPTPKRAGGRLSRAWKRFLKAATCSNVNTFDPPLQGVPLNPGEAVLPSSRGATTPTITTAGAGALPAVPHVLPYAAAGGGTEDSADAAAVTAEEAALPPKGQSSSGSDRSPHHQHTGYLTTGPFALQPGVRPAATGPRHPSPHGVRMPDPTAPAPGPGLGPGYEEGEGEGSFDGTATTGAGQTSLLYGSTAYATQGSNAADVTERGLETAAYAEAEELAGGAGVRRGGHSSISDMTAEDADDWHDARSVASTFSVGSLGGGPGAGGSRGASPRAAGVQEAEFLPQPHHQVQAQPYTSPFGQFKQPGGALPAAAGKLTSPTAAAAAAPATPPQTRRQAAPPPQSDDNALTGQFSTPVLAAPHRTGSNPLHVSNPSSAVAGTAAAAAVGPGGAVTVPGGASVWAVVRELELTEAEAEPAEEEPEEAAAPAAVAGPGAPSWAPSAHVPGMDPATRYAPVPSHTGLEGYWAKIPELSARAPMPVDVVLNASRLARSAHESIKGVLLRESDTNLVVKARVSLPLGLKVTHVETYPKDNSSHTSLMRRDVRPGRSHTHMYYTEAGEVLLVCESADLGGRVDHMGYELMSDGETLTCRQWVVIAASGKTAEQFFVGKKSPIPRGH